MKTLRIVLIGAMILFNACSPPVITEDDPRPTRTLVFWDVSPNISAEERGHWTNQLIELAHEQGETLWNEEEYDEIIVQPIHLYTKTSRHLTKEKFRGGVYIHNENERRKARESFRINVKKLKDIEVPKPVQRGTDVLGSIDLITNYMGQDSLMVRKVIYFSDMLHVNKGLNFESVRDPFKGASPSELVQEVIQEQGWEPNTLEHFVISVHTPGTVFGATGVSDSDRLADVEEFWTELFESLGARVDHWGI